MARLEGWIDRLDTELPPLRHFILSDGARPARRCTLRAPSAAAPSGRCCSLGADAVEPIVIVYLNRLSDLLFTMARAANHRAGVRRNPVVAATRR